MPPLRRLFSLLFEPQPRRQPTRPCPTLAMLDNRTTMDNGLTTTVVVRLAELRACRP